MDALRDILIGLFATAMVFFALAIVACWLIYRRIRRSRMVRRMAIGVQTLTAPWGPGRDIAAMRRAVARDADATRRQIQEARRAGITAGDPAELIGSLTRTAQTLDAELALLGREPGRRNGDALRVARTRVGEFRTQTGALRASLTDGVASTYDARMAEFAEQAQLAAFTAQAHRELRRNGAAPQPSR